MLRRGHSLLKLLRLHSMSNVLIRRRRCHLLHELLVVLLLCIHRSWTCRCLCCVSHIHWLLLLLLAHILGDDLLRPLLLMRDGCRSHMLRLNQLRWHTRSTFAWLLFLRRSTTNGIFALCRSATDQLGFGNCCCWQWILRNRRSLDSLWFRLERLALTLLLINALYRSIFHRIITFCCGFSALSGRRFCGGLHSEFIATHHYVAWYVERITFRVLCFLCYQRAGFCETDGLCHSRKRSSKCSHVICSEKRSCLAPGRGTCFRLNLLHQTKRRWARKDIARPNLPFYV